MLWISLILFSKKLETVDFDELMDAALATLALFRLRLSCVEVGMREAYRSGMAGFLKLDIMKECVVKKAVKTRDRVELNAKRVAVLTNVDAYGTRFVSP